MKCGSGTTQERRKTIYKLSLEGLSTSTYIMSTASYSLDKTSPESRVAIDIILKPWPSAKLVICSTSWCLHSNHSCCSWSQLTTSCCIKSMVAPEQAQNLLCCHRVAQQFPQQCQQRKVQNCMGGVWLHLFKKLSNTFKDIQLNQGCMSMQHACMATLHAKCLATAISSGD